MTKLEQRNVSYWVSGPCIVLLQVKEPYKAWYYNNERGEKQVAGFVKQFKNINYITVRVG